jgi:hypothetical protein
VSRGLSELQKRILKYAVTEGSISNYEARQILFDMLPANKQQIRSKSSARPHSGGLPNYGPNHPYSQRKYAGPRQWTLSERRDNAVAASASRAVTRLVRRGLLEPRRYLGKRWLPVRAVLNRYTAEARHRT